MLGQEKTARKIAKLYQTQIQQPMKLSTTLQTSAAVKKQIQNVTQR